MNILGDVQTLVKARKLLQHKTDYRFKEFVSVTNVGVPEFSFETVHCANHTVRWDGRPIYYFHISSYVHVGNF